MTEMKTTTETIAETHWESESTVTAWFRDHRLPKQRQIRLAHLPSSCGLAFIYDKAFPETRTTFRSLEGLTTLVSQGEGIWNLAARIKFGLGASELSSKEAVDALDLEVDVYSRDKKYYVDLRSCEDVLKDLGRFVIGALEQITIDEMALVVKSVATCSVNLMAALESIVAEHCFTILVARSASSARETSWSTVC
jgi:hypothetical protein